MIGANEIESAAASDKLLLVKRLGQLKISGVRFLGHGIGPDYSVLSGKTGIIRQGIIHTRSPEDVAYLDLLGNNVLGPVDNCPVVILAPNARYTKFGQGDILGVWSPQDIIGILCIDHQMKKIVQTSLEIEEKGTPVYSYREFLEELPALTENYLNVNVPKDRPIHPDETSKLIIPKND